MTLKLCSRDDCPPMNTKPEVTVKCFKCNRDVHLPCIGISVRASQIDSPNVMISCHQCLIDSSELIDFNTSKSTPKTEKTTIKAIIGAVKSLASIVEANGKKLDIIDEKSSAIARHTETLVDKATRPFKFESAKNISPFNSPENVNQPKTPGNSYADALRRNAINQSAKRRRTENLPTQNATKPKFAGPKPKIGTKTATSGLSVVARPKPIEKPNFTKAVWVSRFSPTTTTDEIAKYIMENASIEDKTRFNIHKLVKKDQNLSLLKFVSFKLEVNEADFKLLMNEDFWPEQVWVREFLRDRNLGDFVFPALNEKRPRKLSTDDMEITEVSLPEKNSPSKTNSPTQT